MAPTQPMNSTHSNASFNFIQVSFHNVGQQVPTQAKPSRAVLNTVLPLKSNINETNVFQMEYQQEDVKYGSKVPLYHWKLSNNPKRKYRRKEDTARSTALLEATPKAMDRASQCPHLPSQLLIKEDSTNASECREEISSCTSSQTSSLSICSSASSSSPPVSPSSTIPRIPRTQIRIEDLLNPLN
nr:unnamed protein product [Naegleria fowleri]